MQHVKLYQYSWIIPTSLRINTLNTLSVIVVLTIWNATSFFYKGKYVLKWIKISVYLGQILFHTPMRTSIWHSFDVQRGTSQTAFLGEQPFPCILVAFKIWTDNLFSSFHFNGNYWHVLIVCEIVRKPTIWRKNGKFFFLV